MNTQEVEILQVPPSFREVPEVSQEFFSKNLQQLTILQVLEICLESEEDRFWSELMRRSRPFIASVIVRKIRHRTRPCPSLVDDLTQETYLKLCANNFRALRGFKCQHENALFGFLKVIASNVARDYVRSAFCQKRGSGAGEQGIENVEMLPMPRSFFRHQLERNILLREIENLVERYPLDSDCVRNRVIFWLYYRAGFSAKEIARLPNLGLTVKGVESALQRVTRQIKEAHGQRRAAVPKIRETLPV